MVLNNRMMGNWFERFQENVIKYIQTDIQEDGGREGRPNAIFESQATFRRELIFFGSNILQNALAEPSLMEGRHYIHTNKNALYMMCLYRHRCIMVVQLVGSVSAV